MKRPDFLNFKVDHMTLLVSPSLYNVSYLIFRTIFGCEPIHMIYEKRKKWSRDTEEKSLTFAMQVGNHPEAASELDAVNIAVVQPSEPGDQSSHVRTILSQRGSEAHWQHIALRTPDLIAFHKHASDRGVNFITPILRDDSDDVIQVFTGEWFSPSGRPSGMFFEFLQRSPSPELLSKIADKNRESWFNDKTFLGLYGEKEREYLEDRVVPFIDPELYHQIHPLVARSNLWEISESTVNTAEEIMLRYALKKQKN
ncbi:MAG: hypothetical protein AB7F86_02135 [Bdellovibrionales bacterium]